MIQNSLLNEAARLLYRVPTLKNSQSERRAILEDTIMSQISRSSDNPIQDLKLILRDLYDLDSSFPARYVHNTASLLVVEKTELNRALVELSKQLRGRLMATEATYDHNFDLRRLVKECVSRISSSSVFHCFAVPTEHAPLVQRLAERLLHEMRDTHEPQSYVGASLGTTFVGSKIEIELERMHRLCNDARSQMLIADFDASSIGDDEVLAFAQSLHQRLADSAVKTKKVLVLLAVRLEFKPEVVFEGFEVVAEPVFEREDVEHWVTTVVKDQGIEDSFIPKWVQRIANECEIDGRFDMSLLYSHIQNFRILVSKNMSFESFQESIE